MGSDGLLISSSLAPESKSSKPMTALLDMSSTPRSPTTHWWSPLGNRWCTVGATSLVVPATKPPAVTHCGHVRARAVSGSHRMITVAGRGDLARRHGEGERLRGRRLLRLTRERRRRRDARLEDVGQHHVHTRQRLWRDVQAGLVHVLINVVREARWACPLCRGRFRSCGCRRRRRRSGSSTRCGRRASGCL